MLLSGFNHVAVITSDTRTAACRPGFRVMFIDIGPVTDFGPVLSLFFTDPDGLEGEVCVANPDATPGALNPPGTPAARYASS